MRRAALKGAFVSLAITAVVALRGYLYEPAFYWPYYLLYPAGLATFGVYGDGGTESARLNCTIFFLILINGGTGAVIGAAIEPVTAWVERRRSNRLVQPPIPEYSCRLSPRSTLKPPDNGSTPP